MNVNKMIQAVMRGENPRKVLEQYSPGLQGALDKIPETAMVCPNCGFEIPQYPGKYPEKCPECGAELKQEQDNQDDLDNKDELPPGEQDDTDKLPPEEPTDKEQQ